MAVKPLDWIGWREARAKMGEIWDGWAGAGRWEARDRAMIASLRRGKVPYRGEAHEPGWRNYPVDLRVVLAGLVSLPDDRYYPYLVTNVVEYQVSELVSFSSTADLLPPLPGPAPGFQGPSLRTFTRKAELVGFELALGAFYDDLVRYGLPAGAEPKRAPRSRRRRPKPTTKRPRRGKRQTGPMPTADKIRTAGKALIDEGQVPVETIPWADFRPLLCNKLGVTPGTRGYGLDTVQDALRSLLAERKAKLLRELTAKENPCTSDTENTEN
jgi:hypothetical protein